MTALISKIQYKDFEVGEFIEEKKRDYNETIDLIEKFPWNKQRDKIVIDLTNPSITIEGVNNDFLKLAVFFNEKFVLHYIDNEEVLYTKSFTDIKNSYKYIGDCFSSTFDKTEFKKENTWLQHNLKHFVSQNFNYSITASSIRKFLFSTSGISFAYSIFVILLFLITGSNHINEAGTFAILLTVFFIGGGINLILFFNYYF